MNDNNSKKCDAHEQNKEFNVIINAEQKVVTSKKLSFMEIVKLAFGAVIPNPSTIYTMTYKRGNGNKPEGTLVEGDTLKMKEGVIINVTATNKS